MEMQADSGAPVGNPNTQAAEKIVENKRNKKNCAIFLDHLIDDVNKHSPGRIVTRGFDYGLIVVVETG